MYQLSNGTESADCSCHVTQLWSDLPVAGFTFVVSRVETALGVATRKSVEIAGNPANSRRCVCCEEPAAAGDASVTSLGRWVFNGRSVGRDRDDVSDVREMMPENRSLKCGRLWEYAGHGYSKR